MDKLAEININIRTETASDFTAVENVTREAFFNHNSPGCDEHYLMHIMRSCPAFVPELSLVAQTGEGGIVGNIAYTKCRILKDTGGECEVLCFGPISVLPEYQSIGIGSALILRSFELARSIGSAVLIYGDPAYYFRFGFVPARRFNIRTSDNMYAAALQAYELKSGALNSAGGIFIEDSIFSIEPEAAAEFDKSFPAKEKLTGLESQRRFEQIVAMRTPYK